MAYKRVAQLRSYEQFTAYCDSVGAVLPTDEVALRGSASPLARTYLYRDRILANRLPYCQWKAGTAGRTASRQT